MKQQAEIRYIYKLHSSVLKRNKWNLNITIEEAKKNGQLISLAESQTIRFIDDIKNTKINREDIFHIKQTIEELKTKSVTTTNRKLIQDLYIQKNTMLFIDNYVEIIMDSISDFDKCCSKKGFIINNKKYKRLLGTTGGIKKSTVIFVSEDIYVELNNRLNNDRNTEIELVPAKLEAYKALTCSASVPVTAPKGILVVKDLETTFKSGVITIKDSDNNRPILKKESDYEIKLNATDGCAMILPSLAEQWTKDVKEKGILSGFCIRNSYCKGMLFPFDFIKFAKEVAHKEIITDIWGNDININDVEIILTDNMLKLWNCYSSINDYIAKCNKNGYTFSVSKYCESHLENERNLNYQFLQSYNFTDKDIDELILPTVNELKDVLGGDYRKTLLFLKGVHMTNDTAFKGDKNTDIVKALMIEPKMIDDPFIRQMVHKSILKRIKRAKIGVLKMQGCYSIISGDLYALCQHIFGLKVTGLLKANQYYSRYWLDKKAKEIVAFRAPMTSANNIKKFKLVENKEINEWFKYMKTCIVLNAWDTTCDAMNGCDFDSDALITTNSDVMLRNTADLPAIVCIQRTATKVVVKESDLKKANKMGFGDAVGTITNRITTMFERIAQFEQDSEEYKELEYRIKCGQHFQQLSIDKAKGIISKPMPKEWYDYKINKIDGKDSEEIKRRKNLNLSILAENKPYFFIYNYPKLMNTYKRYINDTNDKCMMLYGMSIKELINKENKTDEEILFLNYYYKKMPVGDNDCVMNKICHKIEDIFDNQENDYETNKEFDYTILKNDLEYTKKEFEAIEEIYKQYTSEVRQYMQTSKSNKIGKDETREQREIFKEKFIEKCFETCNNKYKLCNIIIDLCYPNNSSKQFVWDICSNVILETLLKNNNYKISYPKQAKNGDFSFGGYNFIMQDVFIKSEEE